jgi:hypothetical protein
VPGFSTIRYLAVQQSSVLETYRTAPKQFSVATRDEFSLAKKLDFSDIDRTTN